MSGPLVADRVKETSTTTGTGTLTLAGAASGFQGFVAAFGDTNTCYYAAVEQSGSDWEVGIGTVTDAGSDTLSRDTVIASSNSGALVNFGSGTKDVFATYPGGHWGPVFNLKPPVDGDFSWVNQGSATIGQTNGGLLTNDGLILASVANTSAYNWRMRVKSAPTPPYTIDIAAIFAFNPQEAAQCLALWGVGWRQSSDGKLHLAGWRRDAGSAGKCRWSNAKFSAPSTYSAAYSLTEAYDPNSPLQFIRIEDDNTNRKIHLSSDGVNYLEAHSVGRTDFLTGDEVVFGISPYSSRAQLTLLHWEEN